MEREERRSDNGLDEDHKRSRQQEWGSMRKQIIRLVVLLGAGIGLVVLVADAAYARVAAGNHCEPIR